MNNTDKILALIVFFWVMLYIITGLINPSISQINKSCKNDCRMWQVKEKSGIKFNGNRFFTVENGKDIIKTGVVLENNTNYIEEIKKRRQRAKEIADTLNEKI